MPGFTIAVKFNADITPEDIEKIKDDILTFIYSSAGNVYCLYLNPEEFEKYKDTDDDSFANEFLETTSYPEMPIAEFHQIFDLIREVIEERDADIAAGKEDEAFDRHRIWDLIDNDPNNYLRALANALDRQLNGDIDEQ